MHFLPFLEFWQTMLPFIMLVEIVLEIGLFMYQLLRSNKPVRSLLSLAVMAVMIPLLFSVSQADPDNIGDAFLLDAPWLIFAAAIFLAAVHFAIALPREYRRKKNELSPFSIKEATDKLPMGICFADPNGRIILCNNRMRRLSFALCGHELQIKSDMENALSAPDRSVTVKDDCYILPDKTVWQFRTQNITVDSDDRWQQITAHNVTELYNGYQKQEEINEELAEVNRKLRKMYARMENDVKEKESLDLKVYIHDTIGRSLLTIRDIIDSGEDTERKLEALQNAIGMLASNADFVQWILKVKSNIDSGMFRAMQLAAANALEAEQEWYDGNNKNYRNRRHLAGEIMHALGCTYDEKQVGMFLWGKIPDSCADVEELTEKVLHNARVFITPGFIFGSNGKRYIRISLCCKDHKLEEALKRIREMK